jgi:CHAT domain-containing protein/Tfp pilus assembly protein PilF
VEDEEVYRFFEAGKEFLLHDEFESARDQFTAGLLYAHEQGEERLIALLQNALGYVAIEMGDLETGRKFFLEALAIRQKRRDRSELADTWNNLGLVYLKQSQFGEARACYLRALRLYGQTGNKELVTNTHFNLGEIYRKLGHFQQSLATFQRALHAYQELGQTRDIADSLSNIGLLNGEMGHFDKAIAYFTQALDLYGTERHHYARAITLNNLANLYDDLGRFEQALETHHEARKLKEALGNSQSLAYTLENLGAVYQHLGRLEEAQEALDQALQLRQALDNPQELAYSYRALGYCLLNLGQAEQSLDYHRQALALLEPLGNPRDIASALLGAGHACSALSQDQEAHDYFQRALARYQRPGNPQALAQCLDSLGTWYMQAEQYTKAKRCFARSLDYQEVVHRQIGEFSQLGAVQGTQPHFHARFAELHLRCGRPVKALLILERGRASGLARQTAASGKDFTSFVSRQDAAQLQALLQKRMQASRHLRALDELPNLSGGIEQERLARQRVIVQEQYQEAERKYARCREGVLARYPEYRRLQGYSPPSYRQMLALARRHPDTLYLEWAVVNDRTTLLFALSHQEGLHCFTLPIGEVELKHLAHTWRAALTNARGSECDAARALARPLLQELEAAQWLAPQRYARLVLVADGPLLEVPLAALIHQTGERLLDTHAVSNAISLGTLTWPENQRQSTGTLLCVADPSGSHSSNGYTDLRGDLGPLKYARQEAQCITKLFPSSLRLTGSRAREARIKREMPHYGLLHFATHGVLVPTNGLLSWLRLTAEPTRSTEDGRLEGREIMEMPLSAQLAVLSGCDTARGQAQGGEGILGLAWAFRAAGCASVLASSWRVDDEATSVLMEHFYQALLVGERKDVALQTAVHATRKIHPEPYYWAPFQLIGETSSVQFYIETARY